LFTIDVDACLEAQLRAVVAPGFKSALDDAIVNLLNTRVRQIILEGSEDLGIPILDPLRIEHLGLGIHEQDVV
jgi:hypothetical protein